MNESLYQLLTSDHNNIPCLHPWSDMILRETFRLLRILPCGMRSKGKKTCSTHLNVCTLVKRGCNYSLLYIEYVAFWRIVVKMFDPTHFLILCISAYVWVQGSHINLHIVMLSYFFNFCCLSGFWHLWTGGDTADLKISRWAPAEWIMGLGSLHHGCHPCHLVRIQFLCLDGFLKAVCKSS